MLERAAGVFVREDDGLVRIKNLGGFGHEVDAGKTDDVGIGRPGRL